MDNIGDPEKEQNHAKRPFNPMLESVKSPDKTRPLWTLHLGHVLNSFLENTVSIFKYVLNALGRSATRSMLVAFHQSNSKSRARNCILWRLST